MYSILSIFNINNIIIWFDESHYAIENWINHKNEIKELNIHYF
jgi:hypothetical protein